MMSLWDALRMNMMISYQELVRTFLSPPEYLAGFFLFVSYVYRQKNVIGHKYIITRYKNTYPITK